MQFSPLVALTGFTPAKAKFKREKLGRLRPSFLYKFMKTAGKVHNRSILQTHFDIRKDYGLQRLPYAEGSRRIRAIRNSLKRAHKAFFSIHMPMGIAMTRASS